MVRLFLLARVWVVAIVLGYGWATFTGWRLPNAPRERMEPSVRSSPGGYRSHYFWHTGFSGGK
jgi:hypothetical protein